MGSGFGAIYDLKSSSGEKSVSEKSLRFYSEKDERLESYFQRMLSRKQEEDASYSRNMISTAQHYEMNEKGLFGKPGKSRDIRIISSEDPMGTAMDFFSKISEGAKAETMNNGSALYCNLNDGVRINFRPYSSTPDSPAIDICIKVLDKIQKIHFVLRGLV